MKKQVFYLKEKPDYFQDFERPDEIIIWIWKWNNQKLVSDEAHKLFKLHLNYN